MKKFLLLALVLCILIYPLESKNVKEIVKGKLAKFTYDDYVKHQRPKKLSTEKIKMINQFVEKRNLITKNPVLNANQFTLPANVISPGEFEESQAVLISWPSYAYDADGNWVDETFTPGVGFNYDEYGNIMDTVAIAGYALDIEETSPYAELWAKLANAIQQECTVWIRVSSAPDTTDLKLFIQSRGFNLKNYKFLYDSDGENAFWMRDFGPHGVYYSNQDSLAWVKTEYYPFRVVDNNFPVRLGERLKIPVYVSQLETEGGNYMTDGHGQGFYSDVVYYNNADDMGIGMSQKQPWTSKQVDVEFKKAFNLNTETVLSALSCDGGTGHIDIYLKMIDDQNIMASLYPTEFNKLNFPDYTKSNNNVAAIAKMNNSFDTTYNISRVGIPTLNDGTYGTISCDNWNNDARNYINGLTVNRTFIMPIYSNSFSGNVKGDSLAVESMKKIMPGYKIVPIDSRILSPLGGAIHCITMQVPTDNPIRFFHKQLRPGITYDDALKIIGRITNKSGIKSSKFMWKKHTETAWKSYDISEGNVMFFMDSMATFKGKGLIDYFLTAESNNGKSQTYPITAPQGFFTFDFNTNSVQDDNYTESIVSLSPNPASNYLNISSQLLNENTKFYVIDILGNEINLAGTKMIENTLIDVRNLQNGIYYIVIENNGKRISKRFVKID